LPNELGQALEIPTFDHPMIAKGLKRHARDLQRGNRASLEESCKFCPSE
jgi:hypothetical protein